MFICNAGKLFIPKKFCLFINNIPAENTAFFEFFVRIFYDVFGANPWWYGTLWYKDYTKFDKYFRLRCDEIKDVETQTEDLLIADKCLQVNLFLNLNLKPS